MSAFPSWYWQRLAAVAMLGVTLACGAGPSASSRAPAPASAPAAASGPAASAAPLVTLRSAYTTIAAPSLAIWMAADAGYFRDQGLDVELNYVEPGATLLAALRSGELEVVSAGAPSLVLGNLQGLDTMVFGSVANVLDTTIFVSPEIQSAADLRGKTIGVSRLKAVTDVGARLGLQRLGLQPDVDVFTRGTGGMAESLAALEAGAVDGAAVNVPTVFEARKRGYRELVSTADLGILFLSSAVGATKQFLAARPEVGEPFLRALAQAMSRLKADRELSIAVLGKYIKSDDRDLLGATLDYYRPYYRVDPYPEPEAMQTVLDVEENPAARTTRPEDVTDYRFADALRRSGYLDQLPK
jgi:NitT/TauT family transport system substrate-binding protein